MQNDTDLVTSLLNLTYLMQNGKGDRLNVVFLKPGINSQGAWDPAQLLKISKPNSRGDSICC